MDRVTRTEQTLDRFQLQGAKWYAKHYQISLSKAIKWYEWIRDYEKGILNLDYLSFHCHLKLDEQEEPITITPQALRRRCEEYAAHYKGQSIPDDLYIAWRLGSMIEYAPTYEVAPGLIAKVDNLVAHLNGGSSTFWFPYHATMRWCDEQEGRG